MPNSINSLSPNFRDILLNRNAITDTITNNGLSQLLQGIGLPADPSTPPESVQTSDDIEVDGVFHRELDTITNKYQGSSSDYEQYSVNYLPGNTNSTIAGNVWDNSPYDDTAAELLEANDGYLQLNTSKNIYLDVEKQVPVSIEYKAATFQIGSYLDENNNINVGGPDTQPLDIVGSLLNGGGVGFDPNGGGLVSNADIRSSLGGRVLTATGLINDTRLGQLSAGYLATAIGNNIAFELQEESLGRVNLNPLSLARGNSLIVPNFKITVGAGNLGVAGDLLERMSGAKIPFSLLETSIFASESGWDTGNISRANNMISNTGKGQILQMFGNLNASVDPNIIGTKRNGFIPPFEDSRTERGFNQGPISGGTSYAYTNKLNNGSNIINDGPAQLGGPVSEEGEPGFNKEFEGDILESAQRYEYSDKSRSGSRFSWGDEFNNHDAKFDDIGIIDSGNNFKNKNTLLYKTQELFNSNRMKTLVSGHGVQGQTDSQIQNTRRGYMSKGSGVLSAEALSANGVLPARNTFCRTWTTFDRYDNIQDLQKNSGLIGGENGEFPNRPFGRASLDASVLNSTGFVNIGPTTDDEGNVSDIKRFMFSIENLAWADDLQQLLPSEKGPGDPLSGLRGRIMWFPPYDISFNETTSVNWDRTNFIGRGEPIYTYNNTERTGTLSWKIIIDHPNYANYFPSEWGDDEITSFYAGCLEYEAIRDMMFTDEEKDQVEEAENIKVEEKVDDQEPTPVLFNIYFPNDVGRIDGDYTKYEDGLSGSTTADTINYDINPTGKGFGIGNGKSYKTGRGNPGGAYNPANDNDNTDFGLNAIPFKIGEKSVNGYRDPRFIETISNYMKNECKYCKIYLTGYASVQGGDIEKNLTLSKNRANAIKEFFKKEVLFGDPLGEQRFEFVDGKGQITGTKCKASGSFSYTKACKSDRYTEVKIIYDPSVRDAVIANEEKEPEVKETKTVSIPKGRFFTETHYFKKLEETDNFIYSSIKEKIRYFHPSFHSMTPEGFNSRLNFLHQCTRQGPTQNNDGNPNNLAFGRPPVCILRVGDFYHTKIVIDSMTLDFEPLVWDLNPEGVGVQPMIANVTISFAFIGGSSLEGPINKLQNAISYNFFANAEVYDARADRIVIKEGLQANDEGKGYGEIVPGERVNSPVVPLDPNAEKEGLNNNTVDPEKDQEAISGNEANKPDVAEEKEVPQTGSLENDRKILEFLSIYGFDSPDDNSNSNTSEFFKLGVKITKKDGIKGPLTKTYVANISVISGSQSMSVGFIRFIPVDQDNFKIETSIDSKNETYEGNSSRIVLKTKEYKSNRVTDAQIRVLNGFLTIPGSSINVKWNCNGGYPRSSFSFNESLDGKL